MEKRMLWVEPDSLKLLKIVASTKGITMQKATKEAISLYVEQNGGEKHVSQ